jgi:hypothetical protein
VFLTRPISLAFLLAAAGLLAVSLSPRLRRGRAMVADRLREGGPGEEL